MSKRKSSAGVQDPYADREANKYDNPIPSREYILQILQKIGKPVSYNVIRDTLLIDDPIKAEALRRRLNAMERDGQLMCNRRGKYGLIEKMDLLKGVVIGHPDGFGFVELDEGGNDLFLNPQQMRFVFDGDRVLVRASSGLHRQKREAVIIEVLERAIKQLVGRLFREGDTMFLAPDNKRINRDILIPASETNNARVGQMAVVELIESPEPDFRKRPLGRVVEVLGEHMDPGMEIDVAMRTCGIPYQWPEEVDNQIKSFKSKVQEADKLNRKDLRDRFFVTIDGDDAKDFDDAVYVERLPKGGWLLYVAIADVSYYVTPNTPLDAEAIVRGNSVYFPGRVIPMLPEILSNELCSLKPLVDRLCMVCEARISSTGKITRYSFYEAVIHSQARLTYTQVGQMLEGRVAKSRAKCLPHIQELHALYQQLHKQRKLRGAIDFEFPEPKIVFDADRKIEKIIPSMRNDAHRLIEECMLLANVCAASFLEKNKTPALYRVHQGPDPEKLKDLRTFLQELGLKMEGGKDPEPKDYSNVLAQLHDRPDALLIETLMLRSMSQAVYTEENIGHFGLAFPAYAHFTSPIRRYPDLLVHRAIKYTLQKNKSKPFRYSAEEMHDLGSHCSKTERRADEATRGAIAWLKCEFMENKIGQIFNGRITSAVAFGIFVELDEFFVEGLVHVTSLKNDYYHYDAVRHQLRGERTGQLYRIGDRVTIQVVRVNLEDKQIDFELYREVEVTVKTPAKTTNKRKRKRRR